MSNHFSLDKEYVNSILPIGGSGGQQINKNQHILYICIYRVLYIIVN